MPAQVSGIKTRAILQPEERGTVDRYGVDMITRTEEIPVAMFPKLLRSKYSVHPRFGAMAISKYDYTLGSAGKFYRVTYLYEGFLLSLPEPIYTLSASTGEEPIELHPDFTDFAGTPAVPLNGAIFVDPETNKPTRENNIGVFREFKAIGTGESKNPFAGVEAYLVPGATWQETTFSIYRPNDLGDLGKKDNPSGPKPSFGSGRNWLYNGAEYTRRGHIYEIRKTWLLSQRGGWNEDIY